MPVDWELLGEVHGEVPPGSQREESVGLLFLHYVHGYLVGDDSSSFFNMCMNE